MQDAARRTEEFELLTQIGQVVSSRLDPDEVLRTVQALQSGGLCGADWKKGHSFVG